MNGLDDSTEAFINALIFFDPIYGRGWVNSAGRRVDVPNGIHLSPRMVNGCFNGRN